MSHPMPCRLNSPRSATTAPSLTTGWSTQMTDGSSMTKACTVAAVLCELLETHMQACDVGGRPSGDHHHHIVSAVHGTRADVEILSSCENDGGGEVGRASCRERGWR